MFAMHGSAFIATFAVLAGCASAIGQRDSVGNPRLERLSPAGAERIQSSPRVQFLAEDLARLSRDGLSADQIIDRYQHSGARLKLTPAQLADLRQRGVDQRVLDHIVQREREAEKVDALTREADRDAAARDRAERARRYYDYDYRYRDPSMEPYPYWSPRLYPHVGYGWRRWGSGWHGGVTIGF
jgi:hypothetical protein